MTLHFCSFTSNYYPYTGGLERYQHQLSLQLIKQGHRVTIVTSNTKDTLLEEEAEGIRIIRLPVFPVFHGRMPVFKPTPAFFRQLKKIMKIDADCYHVNMRFYFTSLLGAIIGRLKRKPVLLIDHVSGYQTLHNSVLDFIGKIYDHMMTFALKPFVSRYYGVSGKVCNWLEKYNIKCSGIIYNGISPDYIVDNSYSYRREYNISKDDIIISFGGRIVREKGVEYLVKAFKEINHIHPHTHLFIAGTGPELTELQQDASENNNIHFTGEISYSRMMSLLDETDIVCIPSYFPEGLPTLILEGGLLNCALVSTDRGGTREVINEPGLGIIIKEKSTHDIIQNINFLIENPEKRLDMAKNLHNRVTKHFNWETIAQKFAEEAHKLIK